MKKIYSILLAALAVCAVSCQEGPLDTTEPETPEAGETMTFTASMAETKTTLQGNKSVWVAGDKIKITSGETTIEFTSTLKEGETSETTTFTASNVPADFNGPYTATYGQFSANQTAVANSYDPAVVELKAQSDDHNLYFTNTTALLKLNIQGNDNGKDINSVSFVSKEDVVTLTGSKLNGVYYMAVQSKEYSNIFICLNGTNTSTNAVKVRLNPNALKPQKSKILDFGEVQHSRIFLKGNTAATHQAKEWGEGGIELLDAGNGSFALTNHTFDEGAEFQLFVADYYGFKDKWFGLNDANKLVEKTDIQILNGQANIKLVGKYNLFVKHLKEWWEKNLYFEQLN